jgi:hypothetical protein
MRWQVRVLYLRYVQGNEVSLLLHKLVENSDSPQGCARFLNRVLLDKQASLRLLDEGD